MSALDKLNLVADTKQRHLPMIQVKRNKLASRLWEQLMLAKGQIDGTPFVVTINLPLSVEDDSSFVKATVPAEICLPLI